MKIIEKEFYTVIKDENNNINSLYSFLETEGDQFSTQNLVVDVQEMEDLALEEVVDFLPFSQKNKKNKKSFVVVTQSVNIDDLPEELSVVPTLAEAEDLIQMEEIERDLGL